MYNDTTSHTQNSTVDIVTARRADENGVARRGQFSEGASASDGTPPYSHTGATVPPHSCTGLSPAFDEGVVDWLEFTLPVATSTDFDYYFRYFANWFRGAQRLDYGRYGYTRSARVMDSGLLLWHPERLEMGFHVSLPATALAVFARLNEKNTPYTIMTRVRQMSGWFTRIDIACDTDLVPMETVLEAGRSDQLVTRAKSVRVVEEIKGTGGATLYIGSPASEKMVRFYDKGAQMGHPEILWTRCEIQFRAKYADEVADILLMSDVSLASLIGGFLDFRNLDNSRVNRRSQVDWWASWVGRFERIRVILSKVVRTMEETVQYVEKYLASVVAVSWLRMGDDWLQNLIDQGLYRAKPVLMERFANS